jgi:5'-phosphate synthase pdxT subunit
VGDAKRAGVLALQGDFDAHQKALARAGVEAAAVRAAADLDGLDGLVIPGGESTTMLRILKDEDFLEPLRQFGRDHPLLGTCAGAILMAAEVSGPAQESLGLVDIAIERNAYGRQLDSRIARLSPEEQFHLEAGDSDVEAVFIRAPIIRRVGARVQVLLRYDGDPVLISEGLHLVATFHPELTADARIHRLFAGRL